MTSDARLGLAVKPLDVGVELLAVDPPDAAAADLHGGQIARPNQRVSLSDADVEIDRNVLERQKPRLYGRSSGRTWFGIRVMSHPVTIAPPKREHVD